MRRVDTGLFSEWLVDRLAAGDELEVAPPQGRFTPELTPGAPPRLRRRRVGDHAGAVHRRDACSAPTTTRRVTLFYGNRRTDTVMFTEELADLKNRYGPRLQLVHVLSREPLDAELVEGRLDARSSAALRRRSSTCADVDHWWLCGPLGMVTDAPEVLGRAAGSPRARCTASCSTSTRPRPSRSAARTAVAVGGRSRPRSSSTGRSTTLTPARRRAGARRGAAGARRPAVRLQGRGVRHLPGPGHQRRGRHAPQLRPRGRRGRGRATS